MSKALEITRKLESLMEKRSDSAVYNEQKRIENIKDWNNQPDTIAKIDKALHKHGYLQDKPDFHVDEVNYIRMQNGPGLSVLCQVWASNGEEDLDFNVSLVVNRKGEFK